MTSAAKPATRLRGRPGQRQRARRMARTNGLCERCLGIGRWKERSPTPGRVRPAAIVNHIVPLDHGGEDVDENTENLCRPCDLIVTAEQFEFSTGKVRGGCDVAGRPTDPAHPWNRRAKEQQ